MESGQGIGSAIAPDAQTWQLLRQELSLTEGQRQAIEMTATTTDQFVAWQGSA